MKSIRATFFLRLLLALLFLLSAFVFIYVLPMAAAEHRVFYPELAFLEKPMLLVTRGLTAMFLVALLLIMYMTLIYDRDGAYTMRFLFVLRLLTGIGFMGAAGVTGLFFFLSKYGGPGPALGIGMIGGTLCILIVSVVFILLHSIIFEAIQYKETFDTTV